MTTTWRQKIGEQMRAHGESWGDVESVVLGPNDWNDEPERQSLDYEFDASFGLPEGCSFTVWTKGRVYFPVEYDGAESCSSVARHPDGKPTIHVS